jgi:hypothetical protein
MVAKFVVEFPLLRFQIAINRLLGFGGQVLGHLILGAAKDERLERLGENLAGLGVRIAAERGFANMPGLRKSKSVQSSPRWFSIGVPLKARR